MNLSNLTVHLFFLSNHNNLSFLKEFHDLYNQRLFLYLRRIPRTILLLSRIVWINVLIKNNTSSVNQPAIKPNWVLEKNSYRLKIALFYILGIFRILGNKLDLLNIDKDFFYWSIVKSINLWGNQTYVLGQLCTTFTGWRVNTQRDWVIKWFCQWVRHSTNCLF